MTTVLAFDQATTTGWCYAGTKIEFPEWRTGHFQAPKRDEEGERLIIVQDEALRLIDRYTPDLVVWETPFDPTWDAVQAAREGRQPRMNFDRATMRFLTKVEGCIQAAAARRGLPTEHYAVQSWRATLKIPGVSSELWDSWRGMTSAQRQARRTQWLKEQTKAAVTRFGAKVQTFDEADSWGIAFHALHGKAGIARATGDLFERARAML